MSLQININLCIKSFRTCILSESSYEQRSHVLKRLSVLRRLLFRNNQFDFHDCIIIAMEEVMLQSIPLLAHSVHNVCNAINEFTTDVRFSHNVDEDSDLSI